MATPELAEFFSVLHSGDGQAVEALLRKLDPILRRAIRLRLIDGRLRHVLDTTDILQSLLKDFLRRHRGGPPAAGGSGGLRAYLAAAVRNKIGAKARKERRRAGNLPDDWEGVGAESAAAQRVEAKDLSQAIRARLSEPNRRLYDLKTEGLTWAEIAARVGGRPDTLRMRLTRAVAAVLAAMDHKESSHAR